MTLLIGAFTIGLILSLLAMGVLVSFRIFGLPDITTDGSITLGASIAAVLLVKGVNPLLATAAGAAGGAVAGAITGIIHTKFKINALLAGILVMTALYSVNLHVMGRSNVPLMQARTLVSYGEPLAPGRLLPRRRSTSSAGRSARPTPPSSCSPFSSPPRPVASSTPFSAPIWARPCARPATTRR